MSKLRDAYCSDATSKVALVRLLAVSMAAFAGSVDETAHISCRLVTLWCMCNAFLTLFARLVCVTRSAVRRTGMRAASRC